MAPALGRIAGLGLALLGGCASTQGPSADDPERPFIRRADRQMVVALHWLDAAPGARELLGRRLQDRLSATYRVPVRVESSADPYPGLLPSTLEAWAAAGIDDALIVEAKGQAELTGLEGQVRVIALATQDVLHTLEVRGPPQASVSQRAARFADNVYLAVSRSWTAPGRAPLMDPLKAANHLYRKRACAHALPLYDLALSKQRPERTDQIKAHAEADARRRACRARIANAARLEADAAAVFGLDVRGKGDLTTLKALRRQLEASGLRAALAKRTAKPAWVELDGRMLRLSVRHDPARVGFPVIEPQELGARMDLEPLLPVMRAFIRLRDFAAETLPEGPGELLAHVGFSIRLEHLDGDGFTLELADLDGEPVIARSAALEVEGESMRILARDPDLLRQRVFLLGPLTDQTGHRTKDAMVVGFMTSAR